MQRREAVVFDGLVGRMAERAVPPGIDPEQERIAMEAAATGIREAGWIVAIVGLIGVLAGGAAVALYLPGRPAPQVVTSRPPLEEGVANPTRDEEQQPRNEDVQARLDDSVKEREALQANVAELQKERDTLRGRVSDLERSTGKEGDTVRTGLAELQKERDALRGKVAELERGTVNEREALQSAVAQLQKERDTLRGKVADQERGGVKERESLQATVAQLQKERDTLRGKVADLERRVASLNEKPAAVPATTEAPRPPRRTATPAVTAKAPAGPRGLYVCGDGRTARDPSDCKSRASSASPSAGVRPDSYLCGDGRSVRDPAACRSGG
jgi:predicted nuclease with TOPRIM domain